MTFREFSTDSYEPARTREAQGLDSRGFNACRSVLTNPEHSGPQPCGSWPSSGKNPTASRTASSARAGRARHVPDQAVAYRGERSLMGTPTSHLTRTIVVKAVLEKYS